MDERPGVTDFAADEQAPQGYVHRIGLHQPDVAIDARTFVEPAFAERGIDAYSELGRRIGIDEIGDVDTEGCVAAGIAGDGIAVHEDDRVAEHAVEFEEDAAATV